MFSIHVNNPLNLTYSSSFNMTHNSISILLLKPAAWKDFSSITVPDFCGLVLHSLLRAMCQQCTQADTDNSLRLTCASRSSSSSQTEVTTKLQAPAQHCGGEITFSWEWRCPERKAGLFSFSQQYTGAGTGLATLVFQRRN